MARRTSFATALVLVLAAVLLASCGSDDPNEPRRVPAAIVIVPNAPTIPQKTTRQLTATVVDAAGREIEGETVTYASTDTTILTVSATGLLTSVGPLGTTTIVVADGELTGSIEATVVLVPNAITVTPNPLQLQVGSTQFLSVIVTDQNSDPVPNAPLTFASSNPALVSVTEYGYVSSVAGTGLATITVTSGSLVTTVPVTVMQVPTSITVSPTNLVLSSTQSQLITVVVLDGRGDPIPGAPVAFASSDPSIVTVSNTGVVHSVGPDGGATITVTSGTLQATVGVFIGEAPAGTVLATVPLLGGPWGVAVTSAGKYYVTTLAGSVYSGAFPAYAFPGSLSTGAQALSIAINAAGTTGYVAQGFDGTDIGIAVVDLASNSVTDFVPISNVTNLTVALSKDENTLFVGTDQGLQVVDVPTLTVVNPNLASGFVNAISRDPASTLLYAGVGGVVLELDGVTRTIARTLPASGSIQGTVASQDGTELYIAIEGGDLLVWDLVTNTLKQSMPGQGGFGIGLSPDGKFLYVTVSLGGQVRIIDRASRTLLRTISPGGSPRRVAFDPATGTAVVANEGGWVDFIK